MESIIGFFQSPLFALRNILDIALVAYVIYRFLLLIRGTRGVQMTFGIVVLLLIYWISRIAEMKTIQWLLSNAVTYIVFAIIVLFQSEIRRGLAGIGKTPILGRHARHRTEMFEEIAQAATTLASRRIGALIVIERDIGLKNYVENGIVLDAVLAFDLLVTIFNPHTPLHDGAVIIQHNRIASAACFLPLTLDPYHSKELGTRHRAAIGITEETDAVAVIVSEETGVISMTIDGRITRNLDGVTLRAALETACEHRSDKSASRLPMKNPETT
jgi:diadenylate cyclase